MRRNGPRPVSYALDAFQDRVEPTTTLARVQRAWLREAGAFAERSFPRAEHDGVVTVACESSVVASELALMSEIVVQRLNSALGGAVVTRLRTDATGG
jgi:predicted nucleic acid-binding Zn ribbon protein